MFQFRRFPTYDYLIHRRLTDSSSARFPHSEIHGSKPAFGYPWLIADRCVLRRLLVPRHSPCALCSLTISLRYLWFFGYIILDDNICSILYYPNKYYLSLFFVQFSRCNLQTSVCNEEWIVKSEEFRKGSALTHSILFSLSSLFCVFDEIGLFFRTTCTKVHERGKKFNFAKTGGLKWTRTTDLTLIRRAL